MGMYNQQRHPELRDGEVWVTNTYSPKCNHTVDWDTARVGRIAYDKDGVMLPPGRVAPIFVHWNELRKRWHERNARSLGDWEWPGEWPTEYPHRPDPIEEPVLPLEQIRKQAVLDFVKWADTTPEKVDLYDAAARSNLYAALYNAAKDFPAGE